MKAILLFAVLALAVQAQTPVHEFFHSFISNIHMDAATQNHILNDGLECINSALTTLSHSIKNIKNDVAHEDIISTVREAVTSMITLENEIFPRCIEVLKEFDSYMGQHHNINYIDSDEKFMLAKAELHHHLGEVMFNAVFRFRSASEMGKELASAINIASGLVQVDFSKVLEHDWRKNQPFSNRKFVPEFFKGFFTTIGVKDLAQINATAECVLDIHYSIGDMAYNLHAGEMTRTNAFLSGILGVTNAVEKCKKLNTIDFSPFAKDFVQFMKRNGPKVLVDVAYIHVHELPAITQAKFNIRVLIEQGQYEAAGQQYAEVLNKFEYFLGI